MLKGKETVLATLLLSFLILSIDAQVAVIPAKFLQFFYSDPTNYFILILFAYSASGLKKTESAKENEVFEPRERSSEGQSSEKTEKHL